MLGLDRLVGPRATPPARSVVMERRRGRVNVRYTAGAPADYIFTADIYAFADRRHPDRHLGWWRFELPPDRREAALVMDFDPIRADSVALSVNGATIPATDKWHNPEYDGTHRRLRQLHPCIDAGVTYHQRVGGSGAPGTPPPLGNGRAITQSILLRLLIVFTADIGAEVGRPGPPAGRDWLEPGQNCH